jgi:hypothetical protein
MLLSHAGRRRPARLTPRRISTHSTADAPHHGPSAMWLSPGGYPLGFAGYRARTGVLLAVITSGPRSPWSQFPPQSIHAAPRILGFKYSRSRNVDRGRGRASHGDDDLASGLVSEHVVSLRG